MTEFSTFVLCSRPINTVGVNRSHFEKQQLPFTVIDNRDKSILYGRQKGYETADSFFISFIDDDDISKLTSEHVKQITDNYTTPVYTNSYRVDKNQRTLLTPSTFKKWSLDAEKNRITKPHQTMVIKTETAVEFTRLSIKLINMKKWPESIFDYVFRILISFELGWDYFPEVTYDWMICGVDQQHLRDRFIYYEISNYFFKYANIRNSPSYEIEKTLLLNSS
jgi:hypothetical protein